MHESVIAAPSTGFMASGTWHFAVYVVGAQDSVSVVLDAGGDGFPTFAMALSRLSAVFPAILREMAVFCGFKVTMF